MSEKSMVKIPEDILNTIRSAQYVILSTHVHPDGDALGSTLGFADILEGMGKTVLVFMEEPISHLYSFLPLKEKIVTDIQTVIEFAAGAGDKLIGVALDSGDDRRLGHHMDELLKISPFAVPVMLEVGKEPVLGADTEEAILCESEAELIFEAMGKVS